jgi:hypothetical protein
VDILARTIQTDVLEETKRVLSRDLLSEFGDKTKEIPRALWTSFAALATAFAALFSVTF